MLVNINTVLGRALSVNRYDGKGLTGVTDIIARAFASSSERIANGHSFAWQRNPQSMLFCETGVGRPCHRGPVELVPHLIFSKGSKHAWYGTERREALMALYLHQGDNTEQACRNAGWGLQTARKMAYKI